MKKTLYSIAAVAVILLMIAPPACAPRPEPISILSAASPSWLLHFAKDQGYFAANGLDVTINDSFSGGPMILDALTKEEGDLALTSEFPFVGFALRKASISIIANINKTVTVSLVGRKDRGIQTARDLKGKGIGLVRGTISEFYLGRYLELNGLSVSDVTLSNVSNAGALDALTQGQVDAVVTVEPFVTQIERQFAGNAVVWSVQNKQPAFQIAVGTNDWISRHPETVKRFLKAMDQAESFLESHPDRANAALQKAGYDSVSIDAVLRDNQLSLSLDLSLIVAMNDEARWMMNNNLTTEKTLPDFYNCIYVDGLEAVKPGAVSISR